MHNITFTKIKTFFMNSKNSKTNEPYKVKYDLIDKLDLKKIQIKIWHLLI